MGFHLPLSLPAVSRREAWFQPQIDYSWHNRRVDPQRKIAIVQQQIDAATDDDGVADVNVRVHQNEVALRSALGTENPTYLGFSTNSVLVGVANTKGALPQG
ncbi:hypothetical protein [Candidatus Mycobacterium methanotrophicum]|uniref:Uncharacterized protein n=1 Tax=Candidatus Mycobacterium methanotrophicum TaxID=2943498 RepID=A0ABY4QFV2_9MYCO|nr:hypothetical protein [Candidatus Mycobacterium methanotrophicum]UQX09364.1 hypothetical protein M5I08_13060 [Candidatus Mycobacterium methanotrophicum]